MESLLNLDHALFQLINSSWTHPALDWFFPVWTDFHKTAAFKLAVLPAILALAFWWGRWRGLAFFLMTAMTVGLSDGFFGKVLKPLVGRERPSVAGLETVMRAPHFGGPSFPSNHAANMFCLAVFVGFYFPRTRWVLFPMAALTAYSRVYCGVHFPSDVLGGALLGATWGLIAALAVRPLWGRFVRGRSVEV